MLVVHINLAKRMVCGQNLEFLCIFAGTVETHFSKNVQEGAIDRWLAVAGLAQLES